MLPFKQRAPLSYGKTTKGTLVYQAMPLVAFESRQDLSLFAHIKSPRIAVSVLEIALVCCVGALAALLVLRALAPVGGIGEPASRNTGQSVDAVQMAPIDLFWPANRRAMRSNAGPWTLHGVSFASQGKDAYAILSQGKGREQLVVRQGEALPDGAELDEVGFDFVVINGSSGQSRLYLDDTPAATFSEPANAAGIALPGPLDPRLLERFGLQAGDVVLSIDGQAVRSVADVQAMASARIAGQGARVRIRRGDAVIEKVLQ